VLTHGAIEWLMDHIGDEIEAPKRLASTLTTTSQTRK
jgi:hypothetical protein